MEELGRRVARWVEAGVIGREQGDAILAFEQGGQRAGGRRAVAVEVLGYLGGGLAVVAGFVLGAESWDQLGHWGRAGVLAVVTGVLLGAGWWLRGTRGGCCPGWPARCGWPRWRGSRGCWRCWWRGTATTPSATRRCGWPAGRWSWPGGCT